MQIYKLDPVLTGTSVAIGFYKNVQNCGEIQEKIANGSINAAVVKASLVVDVFQLLVATNKAFFLHSINKMKTRNVFSEILFNLSPSNKISECFKLFGIDKNCKDIIVICLDDDHKKVKNLVSGDEIDLSTLENSCDMEAIRKLYKLNDEELKTTTIVNCVVSQLSSKEIR